MALNFLNDAYFAAKVGIGTESPGSKLTINETSTATAAVNIVTARYGISLQGAGATSNSQYLLNLQSDGGAKEVMRVQSSGNVGIGTTSPQSKLHIADNGAATIRLSKLDNDQRLELLGGNGGVQMIKSSYDLGIYTGGSEKMRITSDGNVGIGITPKTWTLFTPIQIGQASGFIGRTSLNQTDVSTNWYYNGAQLRINTGFAQRYTQLNNGDHLWQSAPTGAAGSTITWTEYMRIDQSTGNVGIGVAGPTAKLQVAGTTTYNSDAAQALRVCDATDVSKGIHIGFDTTVDAGIIQAGDFGVSYRDLSLNPNAGNVGIGTTNPLSQLSIGSNAITTKKPTVVIADGVAGGSLVIRGLSPILSFDRTGASPENKILMDGAGLEFKTGTLDAEGDVDFKIKLDGKLQAPAYTQGFLQSDASGNIEISGGGTLPGGPFLPLAGGTMTAGAVVTFLASSGSTDDRLKFGSSGQMQLFHDGSDGYIVNSLGDVRMDVNTFRVRSSSGTETMIKATQNDNVELYFNNVRKIRTTSGGVFVEGEIKIDSALLSNQENTDVDTGTETVASVAIATYTAAFFDFVIKKTTNVRSGTVYACHDGTTVQFTETSTQDLGDTSDVTLSVDISGGNMRLRATTTSDDWSIKSLIRAI